jgi:hypothetical protein
MIEQFALHKNTDPVTKEVKERIFNYPGIQIRNEGNTAKYVVLFSHEKKLTREDFGLDEIGVCMKIINTQFVLIDSHLKINRKKT